MADGGAFHSFFRSKLKAPKTPPSHGLTGFAAIKSRAKPATPSAKARAARKLPRKAAHGRIESGHGICSLGWPQRAKSSQPGQGMAGQGRRWRRFSLLFQEQIKAPGKRPHRTVSGTLLLSNQERNRRWLAGRRQLKNAGCWPGLERSLKALQRLRAAAVAPGRSGSAFYLLKAVQNAHLFTF